MRALCDARYKDVKPDARLREMTTPKDRRDAAVAAADAKHYDLSATADPAVLFDLVVIEALNALSDAMASHHSHHLSELLDAALKEVVRAHETGFEDGVMSMKAEFRQWLGIGR
jgi:hypothetical protein